MPMKREKVMLGFSMVLYVIGFGVLIWIDWRVALGAFLVLWANNIMR